MTLVRLSGDSSVPVRWVLDQRLRDEEMSGDAKYYPLWRVLTRFVAPAAVAVVFVMTFL